ncbi:MAG TPA: hypothetical protein VK157_05190 [Phycisphaerales bacterium]|nr:hypothetical protein [Phycisphaerales bacterium]
MAEQSSTAEATSLSMQTTTVNKKWAMKMTLIAVASLALFAWGVVDALVVYPKRGARAAEFGEFQHLAELQKLGTLSNDLASVKEPATELDKLLAKQKDNAALSADEKAKLDWLTQLKLIGQLNATNTSFPRSDFRVESGQPVAVGSADERLVVLRDRYTKAQAGAEPKAPSPLSWWDIPSQWAIALVGLVGAVWLIVLMLRVKSVSYSWNPATKTLTLPGGATLAPADIVEFDKSRWEKFYISLVTREDHPTFKGAAVELDLYRHTPLEDWVLEMEKEVEARESAKSA